MSYTFTNCPVTGGFSYVGRLVSFFFFFVNRLYAGLGLFKFDAVLFWFVFLLVLIFALVVVRWFQRSSFPLILSQWTFSCLMSLYMALIWWWWLVTPFLWSCSDHDLWCWYILQGHSLSPVCSSLFIKAGIDGQLIGYGTSPRLDRVRIWTAHRLR